MLKDDLFYGVGNMRIRNYDFLVDVVKLLREGTACILSVPWEGSTEHLGIHSSWLIEIIGVDNSLPDALYDELFDAVVQGCIGCVFAHYHERSIQQIGVDYLCEELGIPHLLFLGLVTPYSGKEVKNPIETNKNLADISPRSFQQQVFAIDILTDVQDLIELGLGDVIVPPRLCEIIIVEIIRNGVLSIHGCNVQPNAGLSHNVIVMLQQFLNPSQAQQHAFVVDASNVLVYFHQQSMFLLGDAFKQREILVLIAFLVHLLSQESINLLQPLQPTLTAIALDRFPYFLEIKRDVFCLVLLIKLFTACRFQDLAEEFNNSTMIHSTDDALHDLRMSLIEVHELY